MPILNFYTNNLFTIFNVFSLEHKNVHIPKVSKSTVPGGRGEWSDGGGLVKGRVVWGR